MIRVNSINPFKQKLLPLIRLLQNSIFNIFDPEGLKLLSRLCLGLSHLNKHRFQHNCVQKCLKAVCTCSLETEHTSHYLLHCHHNIPFCSNLTHNANTFVFDFELLSGNKNVEIILYGDSR